MMPHGWDNTGVDGNRILALADDLTGALEVGARFAGAGVRSAVAFARRSEWPDAAALVLDTESRHLGDEDARARIAALAPFDGFRLIYKKTDSTLRGPVAGEFRALVEALRAPLVYVPAYPAMGRTVRGGVLYVHGTPVHETEFARDLLNPVRESSIPALLAASGARVTVVRPCELREPLAAGIWVVDGDTDEDVDAAARFLARSGRPCLAAGPGALAGRLAAWLDLPRRAPAPWPRVSTCLVVNGSMRGISALQVRRALGAGWPEARPGEVPQGWSVFAQAIEGEGLERARGLAVDVREMMRRARPDALFVIGGDTAAAVLHALGAPPLDPVGEITAGVPVSRAGDFTLITKAGGFGQADLLLRVRGLFCGSR